MCVCVCVWERDTQTDAAACVVYPSIKRERGVAVRAGRSYLSLFCVTVPSYKFRIASVMSKAFHGVINIWQKTWLFYQTNIFTISFLFLRCEPRVTEHYRLLLLSRMVLLPNQPHTSMHPILLLWDQELKFPLVLKKTKHLVLFHLKFHLPQSPSSFTSIITTFTSTSLLFQTSASLSLIHVCHFVYSCSYSMEWYRTQMQSSESGRYRMAFPCVARKCKQPVLFTVVCSCSLLN